MTEESMPELTEISDLDVPPTREPGIRWFAVALAVAQLALLVVAVVSLWRIGGGGWFGVVAASVFALLFVACWQLWLAPGSPRRLGYRERLTVMLLLGPCIVVMAALGGLWLPALVVLSVIILCDALNSRPRQA